MPGAAFAATSTSTQSWNDAASTMSVPKRSHAHLIALDAGLCLELGRHRGELGQIDVDQRPIDDDRIEQAHASAPAIGSDRSFGGLRLTHVAAHSPSPTSAT